MTLFSPLSSRYWKGSPLAGGLPSLSSTGSLMTNWCTGTFEVFVPDTVAAVVEPAVFGPPEGLMDLVVVAANVSGTSRVTSALPCLVLALSAVTVAVLGSVCPSAVGGASSSTFTWTWMTTTLPGARPCWPPPRLSVKVTASSSDVVALASKFAVPVTVGVPTMVM